MANPTPLVKLLDSGYWHVRWNANRWFQWPKGRSPTLGDGFGWVTELNRCEAEEAVEGFRSHA